MDLVRKLLSKLRRSGRQNNCRPEACKDGDDPANVLYETFEWGYKYPEEEIGCGINLMKHRNEL